MAMIKCKMCGGDLEVQEGMSVCTCEYCGSKQTLPKLDDEQKSNMYDRANHFRRNNEYDKAAGIYERVVEMDPTDEESYWSLVLCRYGIEYVEDPATHKRIPTINRAQYTSIYDDDNYKSAIEHADALQRQVYEEEAKTINEIQKGILEISQKEEPFDVFICYKETDANGRRTPDSVLANDLYHQLTQEGFKVFFSRITLEDKLGTAYEPYIFAALNSAKVMVVIGTKPEYFNAVWVRNEWSRFLSLIKNGAKKVLIPAYRDMDPYDLPEEFSHLQAQDMSKLGFMQDLIRGIKKLAAQETAKTTNPEPKQNEVTVFSSNVGALLKRGYMALDDREWDKADGFFEEVLNQDAECAEAYLGKFLAKEKKSDLESWIDWQKGINDNCDPERLEAGSADSSHIDSIASRLAIQNYLTEDKVRELYDYDLSFDSVLSGRKQQKLRQLERLTANRLLSRAKQYGKGEIETKIENALSELTAVLEKRISDAQDKDSKSIERVKSAYASFIKDADQKAEELNSEAQKRQEADYQAAKELMDKADDVLSYEKAKSAFRALMGYKDSEILSEKCQKEIDKLEETKRLEAESAEKKQKRTKLIAAAVVILLLVLAFLYMKVLVPNNNYKAAKEQMEAGNFEQAIASFEALNGYKDSTELLIECKYQYALSLIDSGAYDTAYALLEEIGNKDAIVSSKFERAQKLIENEDYDVAYALLEEIGKNDVVVTNKNDRAQKMLKAGDYNAAYALLEEIGKSDLVISSKTERAQKMIENGDYDTAYALLEETGNKEAIESSKYNRAKQLIDAEDYEEAYELLVGLDYKDSIDLKNGIKSDYYQIVFPKAEVGGKVYFGAYEQDNDLANGQEDIEWFVLAKEGDRVLMTSKYALDCQVYNTRYEDITWETSSLRKWLNEDFLNTAFSKEEQERIEKTKVTADENPDFDTDPGNSTIDHVFLLSIVEAKQFFTSDDGRKCEPSLYAKAQNDSLFGKDLKFWWLRTTGRDQHWTALVQSDGGIDSGGSLVGGKDYVRPALWIDLKL